MTGILKIMIGLVQLNTVWIEDGHRTVYPINIRKAYTDLPSKIPGIESAVQIYVALR